MDNMDDVHTVHYYDQEHGSHLAVSPSRVGAEFDILVTVMAFGPSESADGTPIPGEMVRVDLKPAQAHWLYQQLVRMLV